MVGAGPAIAPLGAARVLARPVALGGQPVGQGELGATSAVLSYPTDQEGIDPGGATAPVVHASHAVTVVRRGAAIPAVGIWKAIGRAGYFMSHDFPLSLSQSWPAQVE